ncbi:MAG: UDP-3-O-(3-hydroxymyristoyl)glucosamine N-acyltransferase [Thermodesulfobacteriota bacterium]
MSKQSYSLAELARHAEGEISGDPELLISGFAPLETAMEGDISFLVQASQADKLGNFNGSAVIVPREVEEAEVPIIRVDDPYLASARIHTLLLDEDFVAKGVHERAWVGEDCHIPDEVTIAPLAVIGDRVEFGERVSIESGAVIGDDVKIGDDTWIKANVTIGERCIVGDRVTIHAGTVIGSDGYGYATDARGFHTKRPQVGIVRIGNDVEIGANSCVDRAAYGTTLIKSGTKIDNLVQIAHNVELGENCLIVSQVGISGSTTLGRNVVLGGQVGVTGHISLGDGVMVAAQSGVHNRQEPGAKIGGSPALPMKTYVRAAIQYGKLPEMGRELRKLKKEVAALQAEKSQSEKNDE